MVEKILTEIYRLKKDLEGYSAVEALDYIESYINILQREQTSLPSNLYEAAREYAKTTSVKVWGRIDPKKDLKGYMARANYETGLLDGFKAGAELTLSELFDKLKITPLKVIGKDEYGYPVYDFEVGHYYRTFTLFGEKYKCDQTDSGKAGEQMLVGQGYTTECTVDRTPLNGPAGICLNLHEYDGFKLGDRVVVQIRKKD